LSCAAVGEINEIILYGAVEYFGGATENAEVETAIRAKLQVWKMQEWKSRSRQLGWKMPE